MEVRKTPIQAHLVLTCWKKIVSGVGMLPRQNIKGGCTICRRLTNYRDGEVSYYFYKLLQLNYSATKKTRTTRQ